MLSTLRALLIVGGLVAAALVDVLAAPQAPAAGLGLPRPGPVRGSAVDSSDAVLPGVLVTATSPDGRQLGTVVTGPAGEFAFESLPPGSVILTFHLDGFVDRTTKVTVDASGVVPSAPIVQRLELAALTESVTVRDDPPPPPPPAPPTIVPVPPHDEASVCGPAKADGPVPPAIGTIRSSRKDPAQGLLAAGDEVVIDGGSGTGLAVGQNFVVRRRYQVQQLQPARAPHRLVIGEHSSGVVQIVSVEERVASAVVVYACDAMMPGDYLSVFEPEPIRPPEPFGVPVFDQGVRILFGGATEMVGVARRLMVIDRGRMNGVRPGQRFTLFRRTVFDKTPTIVGYAVVVAVRADSATIRVEHARDAVFFGPGGDWAAPETAPHVGRR
ncbi:MAG: carboxypeptidase regulatory-like domain-containing protein [Acidobacteria bacterium]|nr:carboxypeptidase regulatory-like domain-containing protein [Acidobacteriota bacterium]